MAKAIAEQSNSLSIFFLKKHGYFPRGGGVKNGTITWTWGLSGNKNSIGIYVFSGPANDPGYIKLNYTQTNRWSGEKSDMNYKVKLTSTPCNYGGVRYWFICPLTKNGSYCGRRVGVLYGVDKWFGCRDCANIAYLAQFEGGKLRTGSLCEPDVEKAYDEVKRKYYDGKPTKKYQRYLRLREKMDMVWIKAARKFGHEF
ncbi:hypothetical protein KC571_00220 [candidate division WWE3 bacterium]|uniref:Uncharacterized protein n=1 Tax=candidate division WWE3 bacterium TaxID=2053526 RepID=A0A955LGE9_UNCKA|nr:hypothetical protein [candidate division WWE3 bacterium]